MSGRRAFLGGLVAATATPRLGWADAGAPTHLSAALAPDGSHVLAGLRADGSLAFRLPLPGRGHAAAAHPDRAEAVAFARRPGTYALVIDCARGTVAHRMAAPDGNHFYGHGAFSADGTTLFTTENHIASGQGRIGIWSRAAGYRRTGEIASHGIGPHEVLRLPGSDTLVVANGGILTHPDTDREKLNLDTMRPNLTFLARDGTVIARHELPPALHRNSLRHIAAGADGMVACAFQWEGDAFAAPPLLALATATTGLRLADLPEHAVRAMNAYAGSVAVLGDGRIALTSPRGGVVQIFDADARFIGQSRQPDACGIARCSGGALVTDGLGGVHIADDGMRPLARHGLAFDNHLVAI